MYYDLHRQYWWNGIKCDVASFVARCLTCQQVKAEHRRPTGLLQPFPILEWKWEHVMMDLVLITEVASWSRRHLGDSQRVDEVCAFPICLNRLD